MPPGPRNLLASIPHARAVPAGVRAAIRRVSPADRAAAVVVGADRAAVQAGAEGAGARVPPTVNPASLWRGMGIVAIFAAQEFGP